MTKKQLRGLVDCLANVCTSNTSNYYSLSIEEMASGDFYHGTLFVFLNNSRDVFNSCDIRLLLSLADAWNVVLYFETLNGVTVAKYL